MIRLLRLRNWRSYEHLELRLDPGTTFVVAPNGVGKTSLVYALAWAVFGQYSNVDPKACIRAGAEAAQVDVEVDLPDGRHIGIVRTVRRRGKPTAAYETEGAKLSESAAVAMMEDALGIELAVASRLSMMMGGGHLAASDSLDLESHLHRAFGVAHLLDVAKTAQSIAKEAERDRAAIRVTTKQRMEDRASIESQASMLEAELNRLRSQGAQLLEARDAAAAQRTLVERQAALTAELERYEQQRSSLLVEADALLRHSIRSSSTESISSALRAELELSQAAVVEMTEGAIAARSAVVAAEQALALLKEEESSTCPTCMRALPHLDRAAAISNHSAQRRDSQAEADRLDQSRVQSQRFAQQISGLLARLEALRRPTFEISEGKIPTREVADAAYEEALSVLDDHNRQFGRVQAQQAALMEQLDSDEEMLRQQQTLQLAYRREAAALAGARVLRQAADRVIESHIEPMAREVQARWKHLFASNGLVFTSNGSITRHREGQELGWDTLSGGERTWARIVTHLIVIAATTSIPFAWFDEPLEHLDPQLRHAVASTLAKATTGGSPQQLLVTTYEHSIAEEIADSSEGVELVVIRESDSSGAG